VVRARRRRIVVVVVARRDVESVAVILEGGECWVNCWHESEGED